MQPNLNFTYPVSGVPGRAQPKPSTFMPAAAAQSNEAGLTKRAQAELAPVKDETGDGVAR